ncbi:MAG: adenylyltransferase/cytidyltransferase family protein [Proteobacteria bacterium]|nr:adenylyltransferase/cytidyltransferase family protein [Pseudomonadota bacterium]
MSLPAAPAVRPSSVGTGAGPAAPTIAPRSTVPTVALTYGTYDLFHIGHVRLFERIRQRYDRLVVAVSTDEFNAVKGKQSVVPYADRAAMVAACRWVDAVIPETDWGQKAHDIVAHGADALVMGSDWEGRFDEFKPLCDVVYLPRTEGVSSTELKAEVVAAVRARA